MKHFYVIATQLSKSIPGGVCHSMAMGWRLANSKEEAIGSFVMEVPNMKPGFSVDQVLCMELTLTEILNLIKGN